MKTCIVTTTIHVPDFLHAYADNVRFYGHQDLGFIVIGDKRTPAEANECCRALEDRTSYPTYYYGVDHQTEFLERWPEFRDYLPFNCIQRRNIGLIAGYEAGAEVIITIDDDNLVTNQDFVKHHQVVGQTLELVSYQSTSGWFNVCAFLEERSGFSFYHRGYPIGQRWVSDVFTTRECVHGRVVVNAGFWLDDPDVDTVTRLSYSPRVTGLKLEYAPRVALHPGTWCPFNSQNTALARDVIPAYFLSPYIGRYDDIWASYILRRIMDHLGDYVTYGYPLVRQRRNPHNLWCDLDDERLGLETTDILVEVLRSCQLVGRAYGECYAELIKQLSSWLPTESRLTDEQRAPIGRMLEGMTLWREVFTSLPP